MFRRFLLCAVLLLLAAPLFAACELSMVVSCQTGVNGAPSSCTSTTTNNAATACSGTVFSAWFVPQESQSVHLSAPQTTLPLLDICIGSDEEFEDIPFSFCFGDTSIGAGQSFTSTVEISGATGNIPVVAITSVGNEEGDEIGSAYAFANVDPPTCTPTISAPPVTQSGIPYTVSWTAVSDPTAQFIAEESTSADFSSNVTQSQVNGLSKTYLHDNMATTTTYYYRVRATHCSGAVPPFSRVAQTVVQAVPPRSTRSAEAAVPFGSTTPVQYKIFIPGRAAPMHFTASIDKPYLSVTPAQGTLPTTGIELTVIALPGGLPPGASTGALTVELTDLAGVRGGISTNATTKLNIPISISLVTPVAPGGKTLPPANAMIIPVVTHINTITGPFLSDVRLTNAGNSAVNYQITMTPTLTDARQSSKITQVTVDAQQTIALNDIVKNFFGYGATSAPTDAGFGSLEIRPLNSSSTLTYAASRTYASTVTGTFGQFIAAMPFTKFATQRLEGIPLPTEVEPSTVLSLQHVAQSSKFRTNLGIVEGAGEPASGKIRVYDTLGTMLKEVPFSLLPGEHRQLNRFIQLDAGIPTLEDGRIEIVVESLTGAVTAYASVLDNVTTDPLAVMPVDASKVSATRYVVPGIADLPSGTQNFHSDVRLYNGGTTDVPINLTFHPGNGFAGFGTPVTAAPRTIRAGEVLVLDNILPTLFNKSGTGGSILITTPTNSSLVATGRTYTSVENNGTFGQFIPGVTPAEGIGAGERELQILQLEESDQFRSNVGLTELTGNGATVRLTLSLPDSKVTAATEVTLGPNEFRQLRPILSLNPGKQTYNARLSVEVVGGSGRVTAYGSVIDNESKDPTYVPAQ